MIDEDCGPVLVKLGVDGSQVGCEEFLELLGDFGGGITAWNAALLHHSINDI
mgnify:FL=1